MPLGCFFCAKRTNKPTFSQTKVTLHFVDVFRCEFFFKNTKVKIYFEKYVAETNFSKKRSANKNACVAQRNCFFYNMRAKPYGWGNLPKNCLF